MPNYIRIHKYVQRKPDYYLVSINGKNPFEEPAEVVYAGMTKYSLVTAVSQHGTDKTKIFRFFSKPRFDYDKGKVSFYGRVQDCFNPDTDEIEQREERRFSITWKQHETEDFPTFVEDEDED